MKKKLVAKLELPENENFRQSKEVGVLNFFCYKGKNEKLKIKKNHIKKSLNILIADIKSGSE